MNTFGVFGHACDMIKNEDLDVLDVPPGCIYVTVTLCGLISLDLEKLILAFADPFIYPALRDPIHRLDELKLYFETREITVHHANDPDPALQTYVNSKNNIFFDHQNGEEVIKSGIYLLGKSHIDPNKKDYRIHAPDGMITNDDIRHIYEGAIFPNTEQVQVILDAVGKDPVPIKQFSEFINTYNITQSSLFEQNPGIYYNFACRNLCSHTRRNVARFRRMYSGHNRTYKNTPSMNQQMRQPFYRGRDPRLNARVDPTYMNRWLNHTRRLRESSNVEMAT